MFNHCNVNFRAKDVLFLDNDKNFYNRYILVATCPKCKKEFARLLQTRKFDDLKFENTLSGNKAIELIEKNKTSVIITQSEIAQKRAKMQVQKGMCYGTNIEYKNGDISQYATSFINEQKVLVRKIKNYCNH